MNFILTPLTASILNLSVKPIIFSNYSMLVLAGINMARKKRIALISILLGIATILLIWLEFALGWSFVIRILRITFSISLFLLITYILIRDFIRLSETTIHTILGALCGFIILGIIGGILYELIYLCDPDSFILSNRQSIYSLYYFSFISITTVGYGDVTPNSESAQALTVLLNIIGYFYMTIVVATIVGKYLRRVN